MAYEMIDKSIADDLESNRLSFGMSNDT